VRRFVSIICAVLFAGGIIILPTSAALAQPGDTDISVASQKLQSMESQMASAQKNYQASAKKLAQARTDAAGSRQELSALTARIATNRQTLNEQANYLYRMNNASLLEEMFSSQTFSEFVSKITYLGFVSDSNARVLNGLRRDLNRCTAVQENLDRQLVVQETQTASLKQQSEQATRELASQQAYVDRLSAQQQAALQAALVASNSQPGAFLDPEGNPPQNGTGTGVTFSGEASYYDTGVRTANGERFNPNALTAAHKTLPFGTLVRVTYKGHSVVVRINDRGPYYGKRIIDLTSAAARVIGMTRAGHGYVTCEIVN